MATLEPPLDLGAPATEVARLAAAVTDEQLELPTPCDYPVRMLLIHLLGLSQAFTAAAQKLDGPANRTPPEPTQTELPPGWREELPPLLTTLAVAWRDPVAWAGTAMAGGVELPGEVMGVVANNELVLHAWDLAVATGQQVRVADANLAASWQMVSSTPDDPAVRGDMFGPVLAVSEDAPLLDRLLGGAGRDPAWRP